MKRTLFVAFVALAFAPSIVSPAADDDPTLADVKPAIDALNAAFVKADAATIKASMTPDHVAVTSYYGGPLRVEEQIASLAETKFSKYEPGKMQFTVLDKNVVVLSYPVSLAGTYKGKDVPGKMFASAVWVRRDGKWREAWYQETILEGR